MPELVQTIDLANVRGGQQGNIHKQRGASSLADFVKTLPWKQKMDACDKYFPGFLENDSHTNLGGERDQMIEVCKSAGFAF